jgi:hypothetical protein
MRQMAWTQALHENLWKDMYQIIEMQVAACYMKQNYNELDTEIAIATRSEAARYSDSHARRGCTICGSVA